jgi:hypothetical protein
MFYGLGYGFSRQDIGADVEICERLRDLLREVVTGRVNHLRTDRGGGYGTMRFKWSRLKFECCAGPTASGTSSNAVETSRPKNSSLHGKKILGEDLVSGEEIHSRSHLTKRSAKLSRYHNHGLRWLKRLA